MIGGPSLSKAAMAEADLSILVGILRRIRSGGDLMESIQATLCGLHGEDLGGETVPAPK